MARGPRFVSTLGAAALLAFIAVPSSHAQSRRAPTPAEARVLNRFIGVMTPLLDRFVDPSWQVEDDDLPADASDVSISVDPGVPLDNCIGGSRTWAVVQDSPRFNQILKPLVDRSKALTDAVVAKTKDGKDTSAEWKALAPLNARMEQLSEVTIDVCANSPNVDAAALDSTTPSLLPDVIARKVSGEVCGVDIPNCYLLVFGNWKTARKNEPDHLYDFHFVHPAAAPYLENVVIELHGAEDRIQEMLKSVDWTRVNQALTH
ncbi:MAG: hypothetical protein WBX15_00040 [Thermoanaerobaculia bacterium]